jgi:uridylate kinase
MQLKVMDMTAFSLCRENNLPIIVFDLQDKDSIIRAIKGERIGTLINSGEEK